MLSLELYNWEHIMQFRERDGVCITYEVRGIPNSGQFPYCDGIRSLKEAVAIAKAYPDVYRDGSATHIVRCWAKRYPPGHKAHHTSRQTHRWRVFADGSLQLLHARNRDWPITRIGAEDYLGSLPLMASKAQCLQSQLADLAFIANRIGLKDASRALFDHVQGLQAMPCYEARPDYVGKPLDLTAFR